MLMPLVLGDFGINRMVKYLVYGMLGVAISLCWGYAGIGALTDDLVHRHMAV